MPEPTETPYVPNPPRDPRAGLYVQLDPTEQAAPIHADDLSEAARAEVGLPPRPAPAAPTPPTDAPAAREVTSDA